MVSRLQERLEAAISAAADPLEADLLRAERAGLLAREGRLAEARQALQPLQQRHAAQPDAASAAAIGLAEALVDYYSELGGQARAKLQQARVLAASAQRPALQALCAAWLAHLDYVHNDSAAMARHVALALQLAPAELHSARARACLVAALGYHHGGRFDRAQPWYERARLHANADGDVATVSALMHNMAALRAGQARQAAVSGSSAAEDMQFALGGAESSAYFDDRMGSSALPLLQALLRAQLFVVQGRPREALAVYQANLEGARVQGLARMECCFHADMAWCHAQLQQPDLARAQAGAAVAALRPDCDVDDIAFAHGRLAQVQKALGDPAAAKRHAQQAQTHWQRHRAAQDELLRQLDAALGT